MDYANDMTHASLFSGIGGFDLAAEWAGWTNSFNCEIDPFCQRVLKYHFPDAEQYSDIRTTDFTIWRGRIDVLTGGFPCQPFSLAGKRQGTNDARYLWPAMLDVIRVIRPRWVVGENVFGIINWSEGLVFDEVCSDLEAAGYEVQPYIIPACGVGAPHRRDRCWFVAHLIENAECIRCNGDEPQEKPRTGQFRKSCAGDHVRICETERTITHPANTRIETMQERQNGVHAVGAVADTDSQRCHQFVNSSVADQARQSGRSLSAGTAANASRLENNRRRHGRLFAQSAGVAASEYASDTQSKRFSEWDVQPRWDGTHPATERHCSIPDWTDFPTQSPVRGRNDGVPGGLDGITFPRWVRESIKAYGNAIVPQVALQIFRTINEYERLTANRYENG